MMKSFVQLALVNVLIKLVLADVLLFKSTRKQRTTVFEVQLAPRKATNLGFTTSRCCYLYENIDHCTQQRYTVIVISDCRTLILETNREYDWWVLARWVHSLGRFSDDRQTKKLQEECSESMRRLIFVITDGNKTEELCLPSIHKNEPRLKRC
jgi:hypothetical protein